MIMRHIGLQINLLIFMMKSTHLYVSKVTSSSTNLVVRPNQSKYGYGSNRLDCWYLLRRLLFSKHYLLITMSGHINDMAAKYVTNSILTHAILQRRHYFHVLSGYPQLIGINVVSGAALLAFVPIRLHGCATILSVESNAYHRGEVRLSLNKNDTKCKLR